MSDPQRLAADPGSRIYGVPSVKARYFGAVKRAGAVGRNVFWPEPKIESGLVRIDRRDEFGTDADHRRATFTAIDAAFAQRRKTMRSGRRCSSARAACCPAAPARPSCRACASCRCATTRSRASTSCPRR